MTRYFTFRATLAHSSHPRISRTFMLPATSTFERLHHALQFCFGWQNSHVHEFAIPLKHPSMSHVLLRLGRPRPFEPDESEWGGPPKTVDERAIGLSAMWDERGTYRIPEVREAELDNELLPLRYIYDLGDCWEHEIVVVSSSEADVGDFRLVQGKGRAPLEDSGGVWGWDAIKDAFAAPDPDPEQQDSIEWCRRIAQEGPDFDPATEPDFTRLNAPGLFEQHVNSYRRAEAIYYQ